ncbi:DNA-directed RNA polymerase subunit omega [cyanobacterium endosymbiont of Braarudosphaera bigelowii]|nr:DNA-directed RNA polymerase subunit omega [cyanobacterium endosymbiont of Braarudosphaera bigelowii]
MGNMENNIAKSLSIPKRNVTLYFDIRLGLSMLKKYSFDSSQIMYCSQELLDAASNRYRITVQVAMRAKRRRYEEFDNIDNVHMKPAIRAIIEMSDELTQPEIISDVRD